MDLGKELQHFGVMGDVEPAVQGGHYRRRRLSRKGESEVVGMRMDHVEFARASEHLGVHAQHRRDWIRYRCVLPQGLRHRRRQACVRVRVAARKKRHLVSTGYEGFAKVVDDSFGAAVLPGRHRQDERRDLRDPHFADPFKTTSAVQAPYPLFRSSGQRKANSKIILSTHRSEASVNPRPTPTLKSDFPILPSHARYSTRLWSSREERWPSGPAWT